jgi:hypothetical protein
MRIRAMVAALPFETPKLAVTATVSEHDFATLLDRRLKRIEEMKAKAIEGTPEVNKPALPRLVDRRYRREPGAQRLALRRFLDFFGEALREAAVL